jgi:Zn-dependent protease with chaperone function
LISDTLTWALTKPQLLAVFLHEAGHLKRHHLWWRLSVIVLAGQVLLLGAIATERERNLSGPDGTADVFLATLGLIGLLLLTALLMGFVSRALEFEADGFALEQLNTVDSNVRENGTNQETCATPDDLIAAIRCTAELTGSSPDQVTWMHPSISERIERIRLCHASPVVHQVMCRRMIVLKGALIGAIALFAALIVLHGYAWRV